MLRILNELVDKFPEGDVKQNKNNEFVINCLKSIKDLLDMKITYFKPSVIDFFAYLIFTLIIKDCLVDGNKRFFTIFITEFIELNSRLLLKQFWTELTAEKQKDLIIDLFSGIEKEIKNEENDISDIKIIDEIIKPWVIKLLVFK